MENIIDNILLLEHQEQIVSDSFKEYGRRNKDFKISYQEIFNLFSPKIKEREIWFHLPAEPDLLFSLFKAIEKITTNLIFPIFKTDHPKQIGVKYIGVLENKSDQYLKFHEDKWFFIDEQDYLTGPFDTKEQARIALDDYMVNYLG